MTRLVLATLSFGLLMTTVEVSANPIDDRVNFEVRVGIQGVERIAAVFPDAAAIPEVFLTSLAPDGRIDVIVDGRARAGSVDGIRRDLASRGLTSISLAGPESDARVQLRSDGRVEVSFSPTGLHEGTAQVDPFLAELIGTSFVDLEVDSSAPARVYMGAIDALKELGARTIRIR
jgi:hypothetical protein